MPCPYLAEVTMVFCRASPVRKLIPSDRVSTASHCDGDAYGTCPLFVEALSRAGQMVRELEEESQCSRCIAAAAAAETKE
jgi:hypothetical protein